MKFGDNLKSIRRSKNISQEELAEKIGVSRQSVSKWETGENYPSMQNIVCLCDVFNCKMNDLIHENFSDLDFFDEDIRMSVVKLNKKDQTKIRVLSKILSIFGRVTKILCHVGQVGIIVGAVILSILFANITVKGDTLKIQGETIKMTERANGVEFSIDDKVKMVEISKNDIEFIKNNYDRYSKPVTIIIFNLGACFIVTFLYFMSRVCGHLDKLFSNIYDGDTPFTLENVFHIKKMSYLMIACIITSIIGSVTMQLITGTNEFLTDNAFSIIEIIFLYAIACIFEYGYQIQKDSNGIMYSEENKKE